MDGMGERYILEMKSINKSFFGTKVLSDADFNVKPGELHALVGENGAGKSTLMKIIMGIYSADSGEIAFEGKPVFIRGAREALRTGISMIHQELNPIMEMTIAENIFVGREKRVKGTPFLNRRQLNADTLALLKEYNMDRKISPSMKMKALNIAQIQMIEIIKAVSYNAKLIIMDEPTSSLTSNETEELFKTITLLKEREVGIVYISHRIEEVVQLADRISVLRDGAVVGCFDRNQVEPGKIISLMVGRELSGGYPANTAPKGNVVLEIKHFSREGVFEDISLKVRAGEILGLAGLVGAGRSEVMRALVGFDRPDSGEIYLEGKQIWISSPQEAKKNYISLAPEDRKALGLVLCRSVKENIALKNEDLFSRAGFLNHIKERNICNKKADEMTVKRNSIADMVVNLSGGNQQKVVLAKCLMSRPKVIILDEPTRGIDVGAKFSIYNMMTELTKQGIAIIMISSEMPELIGMSDRIMVMSNGRIRGEYNEKSEISQESILKLALEGV
ncbi:MAG: sugar ABC transporter ATP-binding protein [Treponema sp.]|jgi:ABC-type sugar transport system ATPase subunit|nr:sugar ABC transporter ATP-binding protein [Treponema sp.]